jgi:hypothetical protein
MRDDGNASGIGSWLDRVEGGQALRSTLRGRMAWVSRRLSGGQAVAHQSLLWMQRP